MKGKLVSQSRFLIPALGAVLAVCCGLLLWGVPTLGEGWGNASYDYLFRFSNHPVTNKVVLVYIDNHDFSAFHQKRGEPWDRGLHAQLLNRLAADGCALVAFDAFFQFLRDTNTDDLFAAALRRPHRVVLMAQQSEITYTDVSGATALLPDEKFLSAAGNNWGVAWLNPDPDGIVRHQWPWPPAPYPSLPWTVARLMGVKLEPITRERWIRYYAEENAWPRISYSLALTQPTNFFRDKCVLVATQPVNTLPNMDLDKFSTPYTRWSGEAVGGAEILLTETLNLMNGDWLERPPGQVEVLALSVCGVLLGAGLWWLRWNFMVWAGLGGMVLVSLGGILLGHFSHYWFPWLIVAGGQLPTALVWNISWKAYFSRQDGRAAQPGDKAPKVPGYKVFEPALGEGAYGKVWLAKNKRGEWRALKLVYQAKFGDDLAPFEREFQGITRYQPVSALHPGLLRVDYVSPAREGWFYYAMELGDSLVADWKNDARLYKVRDLVSARANLPSRRLPLAECLRVGVELAEALDFLHGQGLTHRDVKPQNIIFVKGRPKLADPGLVAEIRPLTEMKTYVGTPGFMPPPPEMPGTVRADIYGLGMVLFVAATGQPAAFFPDIATSLLAQELTSQEHPVKFMQLNRIIMKACQPDIQQRYATAAELLAALKGLEAKL